MQFIILRAAFYSMVWLQQYFTNDITYDIYIFPFTALYYYYYWKHIQWGSLNMCILAFVLLLIKNINFSSTSMLLYIFDSYHQSAPDLYFPHVIQECLENAPFQAGMRLSTGVLQALMSWRFRLYMAWSSCLAWIDEDSAKSEFPLDVWFQISFFLKISCGLSHFICKMGTKCILWLRKLRGL